MNQTNMRREPEPIVVTAGSSYLDIDAYSCCVALAELYRRRGMEAVAVSAAPHNYSVCRFLTDKDMILPRLPWDMPAESVRYAIVDVSDPEYIRDAVPLEQVTEVYDHHVGFEKYWESRIGEAARIEFIGAAATLIYREWKRYGLQREMSRPTALLLIAGILDNTLNLTSANTTAEDIETFRELCAKEQVDGNWCAAYFAAVQANMTADLKNALFNDMKTIRGNAVLPPRVGQLCLWDAKGVLDRLSEIRQWMQGHPDSWMINVIDIKDRCSYFVCDDERYHGEMERIFDIHFEAGVAKTSVSYLRKEIIKKTIV